ncbi:MAG: UDP-glucose 4-epimerase GalE [Cyanobacteria bacterium P01_C01_bin.89]
MDSNKTAAQGTILVTGGAGYIGSHAVLALKQASYDVVILDNLSCGHQDLVDSVLKVELIKGDISDRPLLDQLFRERKIDGIMHFAAYIEVGESVQNPGKYYQNNVFGTLTLLEAAVAAGIDKFIFSSTCATYGVPETLPIPDDHPQNPMSPYGTSKLMVEQILGDFEVAHGVRSVCFRYFNAAGADPEGRLGEDREHETHLVPLVLRTAMGKRDFISIYGTDYDTPDGTCVRDYIHVSDLADAHVLGLQYLLKGGESTKFNLGNGNGFSVKEIIETSKDITGKNFTVKVSDRRPGDAPTLVGSAERAVNILGWQPKYADIDSIIAHAWKWHQNRYGASVAELSQ